MQTASVKQVSQRPSYLKATTEEDNESLQPITGYENKPLVSVEKAVEPLIDIVPSIYERITEARKHCRNTGDGVTEDESIAIKLYTMSWPPLEECLYFALNTALCSSDRRKLEPWFLYLRLFFNGLLRLPLVSDTIYRGVKKHLGKDYEREKKIIWWRFSSCTQALHVLQEEQFLGKNGPRTMFIIKCQSGRDISKHSHFSSEKEVLLLPETEFIITGELIEGDLRVIEMQEIGSKPREIVMTLNEPSLPKSKYSAVPFKAKGTSIVSTLITPIEETQSSISIPQYRNSRLQETIADNRLSSELNLASMGLGDQDMRIVAEDAIRWTTSIVVLILDGNQIGPQGVRHLADLLEINRTITTLNLRRNQIGDQGTCYLSNLLRHTTTLTTLDLFRNNITDNGIHYLGNILRENKILQILNLGSNRFRAMGVQYLCTALRTNTKLIHLDLSYNEVGDQGSQYLRNALRENQTLIELNLKHTNVRAQGIRYLCEALRSNSTLLQLNLLENFIGELGHQYLLELRHRNKRLRISY